MNRRDLTQKVAERQGLPLTVVEEVLTGLLDVVADSVAGGEEVRIRRFGRFEPRNRQPVVRRNPLTGEPIAVPERIAIGFVPSRALKQRINRAGVQARPPASA